MSLQHAHSPRLQPHAHDSSASNAVNAFVTAFARLLDDARPGTRSLTALGLGTNPTIGEIDQRIADVRETVAIDILRLAHDHGLDGPDALDAVSRCQALLERRIQAISAGT